MRDTGAPSNEEGLAGEPWQHGEASIQGVRLHYVEMGSGPLVVLLHGFPDFWYSWRHQLPPLAAAGFRALAPDLRGYNQSDKPVGIANYRLELLTEDVVGLIRHVGERSANIVGHDWGGVIAWKLAASRPEVVDRLAILNAPHPSAFRRELRRPAQWRRSAYIFFFQLPWLPECTLQGNDFALFTRTFRRQARITPDDMHRYQRAWSAPGTLTASLNYYRAAWRYPDPMLDHFPAIQAPTLLIWGERDPYLGLGMTEGLNQWVANLRVERFADAGHWVQNDAREQVNRLLCEFFSGPPG